jgi:hypothetical protein
MIIDENFIDEKKQKYLYDVLVGKNFPWSYAKETLTNGINANKNEYEDFSFFTHCFYFENDHESEYSHLFFNVFKNFIEKHRIVVKNILQGRCNITFNRNKDMISPPHHDFPFEHKIFLYYVNDSDGDTLLYKNFNNGKISEELTRVSPKMGKGILFDGKTAHSVQSPIKNDHRIVINISFI